MFSLRPLKREVGKRIGLGTDEINSFVPPVPAEASSKVNARVRKGVKVAREPKRVAPRYPQVETEKVASRGEGEAENVMEREEVVELRKERRQRDNGGEERVTRGRLSRNIGFKRARDVERGRPVGG